MTKTRIATFAFALIVLCSLAFVATGSSMDESNQLWHYRNLGKAFYENPTTQFQAVDMFERALELAPNSPRERLNYGLSLIRAGQSEEGIAELLAVQEEAPEIPHTWFNLGIIYKKEARYEESVKQFEQMVKLVPDEPISHYNLGVVLKLTGEPERALKHFERSAELNPNLAGPYFQMYNAYRSAGREEDAAKALETFQHNKRIQSGAAVPEDLDWSYYSEILDVVNPKVPPAVELDQYRGSLAFESGQLASPGDAVLGTRAFDLDGDGVTDLVSWTDDALYLHRPGTQAEPAALFSGLEGIRQIELGDFDNNGFVDLFLLCREEGVLLRNSEGTLEQVELPGAEREYADALWHDYDHDSDIDLFLVGAESRLLRNNGESGFSDASDLFPFVGGRAVAVEFVDLLKDTNGTDLVFSYADREGVLYRDRLVGKYEAQPLAGLPADSRHLVARDADNDGWTDLFLVSDETVRLMRNEEGTLVGSEMALPGSAFALADLQNRGVPDLLIGTRVYQNRGLSRFEYVGELPGVDSARLLTEEDLDIDGRVDLLVVQEDGRLSHLKNDSEIDANWIRIELTGVRNPQLAPGAEVEVKSDSLYQKQLYDGTPLHFGLGPFAEVDTVRITWPNGLIQNEAEESAGQKVLYKEQQRLSGSCPMVFTWNGNEFEFITDVLAVAPLGASAGEGQFFQVDHDEYAQISGDSLVPDSEGRLEIRITEELREIGYLDQVKLIAVDRPAEVEVFTSDKFKAPPFPEFQLYGVAEKHHPVRALDHRRNDVLAEVRAMDRRYPDQFDRNYLGVAEEHFIELEFEEGLMDPILVLHGWVDWADGSTIRQVSQDSSRELIMPYLQVRDRDGNWVTVIEDMGVPAGKPKTIVVDLAGKFLSESRDVRIVTNLCLYWDEIFLSQNRGVSDVELKEASLDSADLRYRGFSRPIIHPERKQPEVFDYSQWMPVSMWNPAPGMYTRYGRVDELLGRVDDMFAIIGAGDEIRLLFDASSLGPVPDGHIREYLLFVDGWAKDGDLNTAHSQSVEPLPFHEMTAYPYPAGESYPDSEAHLEYQREYNTRPALRFLRPLEDENTLRPLRAE